MASSLSCGMSLLEKKTTLTTDCDSSVSYCTYCWYFKNCMSQVQKGKWIYGWSGLLLSATATRGVKVARLKAFLDEYHSYINQFKSCDFEWDRCESSEDLTMGQLILSY
jgi:hypothetical protein